MDHSENDKRFCVYIHKDENDNVVYVGSGTSHKRPFQKQNRSQQHKDMFDTLTVHIIAEGLSKEESLKIEQDIINEHKESGFLLNKITKVSRRLELEYSFLSKYLYYSEDSPTYIRRAKWMGNKKIHSIAGSKKENDSGYYRCGLLRKVYLSHRVIYCLYHKIDLPINLVIDHIDGDKGNNHPSNLRAVTVSDNGKNVRKPNNNTSGKKGVSWHKQMRLWMVHWKIGYESKTKAFNPRTMYPNLPVEEANRLAFEDACKFREHIDNTYFIIEDRLLNDEN